MIVKEQSQKPKKVIEPGLYEAVCSGIVGIGEQRSEFEGQVKHQNKVVLIFQIPSEPYEWEKDGQKFSGPSTLSTFLTVSLHEKAKLRKLLEGWRGKKFTAEELAGFDLDTVLGKPCQLLVINKEKKDGSMLAVIDNIIPCKNQVPVDGELVSYDAYAHTPESFEKLQPWLQKLVVLADGSKPYVEGGPSAQVKTEGASTPKANVESLDDEEVPF